MALTWKLRGEKSRLENSLESTCELIACHNWPFKTNNYVSADCILCGITILGEFTSLFSIKAKHVSRLTSSLKMQRARYPCRQLNSRTIKSAALCYLSPVVLGKCSIISAKCACKVQEEGFEKAWNGVCRTRDACDKALQGLFIYVLFEDFELFYRRSGGINWCRFSE